jgi:DNA-binding beta-propeller fold protein YncE
VLSGLASVPGTSLVLSVDQNDDVVRAIDLSLKKVTQVITLTQGAGPRGIAIDAAGRTAVVAESDLGKAAILDLSQFGRFSVAAELPAGPGAVAVAIADTLAVVVASDVDRVSVIDLERKTVKKTIGVGRGPKAVAVDPPAKLAYVVNENEGSVSVVDLVGLMVTRTISIAPSVRPESIALAPRAAVAYLTLPAAGPDGRVLVLSPSSGATTSLSANPAYSGGSGAVLVYDSNAYFANQAARSISVVPISHGSGGRRGPITQVEVDRGPQALAIDTQDKLLVVSNEGSGTLVLVDLVTNRVVGRINAVRTLLPGDDDADDHSDRAAAVNLPSSVSPSPRPAGPPPPIR